MKKKILITLSVIIALTAIFCFLSPLFIKHKMVYTPQQNLNAPIEIPDVGIISVQEAENIDLPQVILFYVDWCAYCRKFMPVFGEFAKKYKDKYSFIAVNCDNPEYKQLIEDFHIMGFPSVFVVDRQINHKFNTHMGATIDQSILNEELDNYLKVRENIFNITK